MSTARQEPGLFAAVFLVTLSTVMFEVLLTRVFSLVLWYHFAFMAISIAMLGMTLGALLVFLRPHAWPQQSVLSGMGRAALGFAVSMAALILVLSALPVPDPELFALPALLVFAAAAVPLAFSGVFVCLALTRFPPKVGQIYAADLAGAATGCLAVIAALGWLDGVGAVLACASIAALGGTLLLAGKEKAAAAAIGVFLGSMATWSGIHLAVHERAAFPMRHARSVEQGEVQYERWNSHSRIAVFGEDHPDVPGWSLSGALGDAPHVPSRSLRIDAGSETRLVQFDGDLRRLEFLRWDLTNFAHHLRRDARVCIVGSGGGRDILAAKVFGQKRVVAVEINADILRVANERFGDYTGHLDRDPRVAFVSDEARSYLARSREQFDIVQLTYIDTWAATAAGAYTLTENALYTVEGWKVFLDRLDDTGLLSVARSHGYETRRLASLGRAALLANGAQQPERHMVLVSNLTPRARSVQMGVLLVRKTPFPESELAEIRALARQMRFEVELGGGTPAYSAPTDDQPFFFHVVRFSSWTLARPPGLLFAPNPALTLIDVLAAVALLTLLCIAAPFAAGRAVLSRADLALLAFFAAIGAGFMFVEISMLQRLIIFLGHPVYSLSVILFVLLLGGGLGSRISVRVGEDRVRVAGIALLGALPLVLALGGAALATLMATFRDAATPTRVAVCAAVLAFMGVAMGIAFPLGMRLAMSLRPQLAPWLWAVNGAMSVLASVLAVVLAMAHGISVSFWTGVASYLAAALAFAAASRRA